MVTFNKHINLLVTKENYKKYEEIFIKIRQVTIILSIIVFLISGFYLLKIRDQNQKLESYNKLKINYLNQISTFKENEAKIVTFNQKFNQFINFEKEDANFLPYYNLLISSLPKSEATPSAILSKFKINKDREADFELIFADHDHMLTFLNYIESDTFKKNFQNLILSNFSLYQDNISSELSTKKYILKFLAIFKPINEN